MPSPVVSTSLGEYRGKVSKILTEEGDKRIYSFTGIPYADKPLRFARAKPASPHSGVLNCTKESKSPIQPHPLLPENEWIHFGVPDDCLYLNIFTPDLPLDDFGAVYPVVIFLYGGGFWCGNNNTGIYAPDILLQKDIVLVTVNYRLGPFGFLCLEIPDCPGNQGLHDQILAFKWVKDHINNFCGDPENVSIMGESAGGMSCMYHIVSPLSKGYFRKVIVSSGAVSTMPYLHLDRSPSIYGYKLAEALGCNINEPPEVILEQLRSVRVGDIMKKIFLFQDWDAVSSVIAWKPVVDGRFMAVDEALLPNSFEEALIRGKGNPLDSILMSFNSNDGLLPVCDLLKYPSKCEFLFSNWNRWIPQIFFGRESENIRPEDKEIAENIRLKFFENDSFCFSKEHMHTLEKIYTLCYFKGPFHHDSQLLRRFGYKVYGYNFNHVGTMTIADIYRLPLWKLAISFIGRYMGLNIFLDKSFGVCHADDLFYMFPFKTFGFPPTIVTDKDKKASSMIVEMINSFLKSGAPTEDFSEGNMAWKPISESADEFMNVRTLDENCVNWKEDISYDADLTKYWVQLVKPAFNLPPVTTPITKIYTKAAYKR